MIDDQQANQQNTAQAGEQTHLSELTPAADTTPGEVAVACPTAAEVEISYGPNAVQAAMTENALTALREICSNACIRSVMITSTARTVEDQARIMYGNIQRQGVATVRALYRPPGQAVVAAYEQAREAGLPPAEIQRAMAGRIRQVGPENVSRHIAQEDVCVFDVAPSSIPETSRQRFITEAQAHASVVHFLQPPRDPTYHLEVE